MSFKIDNLSKTFGNGTKALKNVTMNFQKNKITGLIGFNGSGKTTTFNILANFIEKHEGKFTVDGKPADKNFRKKLSYLAAGAEPKNPIKVIKHFYMIGELYGLSKDMVDEKVKPLAKKMDFTEMLNSPIKSLSKGNQQKIKVISSLLNPNMEYLFLDEPFDGLDPIMVEKIKKIFMDLKNVTIILTSHRMEVVQSMCEEFFVLKEGFLVDSRKTDDNRIFIRVNAEVNIDKILKMEFVQSVKKEKDYTTIIADDIKYFKDVNKELIKSKDYIYSSLRDKNIAESVFKGEDL
ncbi:MAG: ABC transporter ATP-binding protein [Mycoplasmatales bacterium]|nr:ABC transporter ATP-binding protein [Mycoplasmatales bacterium]